MRIAFVHTKKHIEWNPLVSNFILEIWQLYEHLGWISCLWEGETTSIFLGSRAPPQREEGRILLIFSRVLKSWCWLIKSAYLDSNHRLILIWQLSWHFVQPNIAWQVTFLLIMRQAALPFARASAYLCASYIPQIADSDQETPESKLSSSQVIRKLYSTSK
jgi:hypothetical protein